MMKMDAVFSIAVNLYLEMKGELESIFYSLIVLKMLQRRLQRVICSGKPKVYRIEESNGAQSDFSREQMYLDKSASTMKL